MKKMFLSVNVLLFFFSNFLFSQTQEQLADSLYYAGKDLYYEGEYKIAKADFERSLEIRRRLFGEEHKKVVKAYYRLGKTEMRLRYHRSAIEILKKGLGLAQKIHGEESEPVADFYLELGNTYRQMYDPNNSKFYYEKAIKLYTILFGENSSIVGNMYMNIGNSLTKMTNFKDANKYYQKAFEIFTISSDPKSKDFNRIYSNWGNLYRKIGDYDKSIDFGLKALEIKLLHYKSTHPSVPKYYSNIGKAYAGKGMFKEGLFYVEKMVELQEKAIGLDHPETGGSYGELGNFYADLGQFQKALELYQKGLKIMEKRLSLTHPYVVGGYKNIGHVYEDMKQYDKALNFYRKSIVKLENHDFRASEFIAITYHRMANVFFEKNDLDSALFYLGMGMENVAPGFKYQNKNGKNPSLSKVENEVDFLDLLEFKSEILEKRFLGKKEKEDLLDALSTLELAVSLIEETRRSYQSETSRKDLNRRVNPIFQLAVRVAFQLYNVTDDSSYLLKALNFSEKSKASILWQSMNENFALENAGIPENVLVDLDELNIQIENLTEIIFESNPSEKDQLQNQLFDLKLKYENQIASLEKFNPEYFELKYAVPNGITQDFINDNLNKSKTFVEYFYDNNNIYTFVIFDGELHGFQQLFSKDIEKSIEYLRSFKIGSSTKNAFDENEKYIAQINFLYQKLIAPIEKEIANQVQLIIVPHGVLNYLPFEMLAKKSDQNDFRQLPYLLRDFNIQYAWSLAFLEKDKIQQRNYKYDYVGFAPSFSHQILADNSSSGSLVSRANLSELNFTETEVLNANEFYKGNVFSGSEASEFFFQKFAPESKIIHLATHAFANDKQPMLSGFLFSNQKDTLEDGYLNAYEIYNMHLPAELTVMSACNTGFGQLADGEGVISLGRAFSYAGCRSVVMSLWMANDQSTAKLMDHFYKDLAQGNRKDVALKNAKIQYLQNADPLTAHPYFWAGMVAIGDMDSISSNDQIWFWWLGLGFVGVLLFFLLRNKNRS
ncbi:MAG: CHAT domain-containing protein [Saprospiraceae bacterium]